MLKYETFQIQMYLAITLKWPLKSMMDFVAFCPNFQHWVSVPCTRSPLAFQGQGWTIPLPPKWSALWRVHAEEKLPVKSIGRSAKCLLRAEAYPAQLAQGQRGCPRGACQHLGLLEHSCRAGGSGGVCPGREPPVPMCPGSSAGLRTSPGSLLTWRSWPELSRGETGAWQRWRLVCSPSIPQGPPETSIEPVICKPRLQPRSPPGPLGNSYRSSETWTGDADAVNICKLPFDLASCLPRGDGLR